MRTTKWQSARLDALGRCLRGTMVALLVVAGGAQANLIRNPSFEVVPDTQTDQGILPSDWLQLAPFPGADTYSNDGSYGLLPSALGNFAGATAFDGIRFVAGWSIVPESFGQLLSTTLTPGAEYTISAFLRQAERADLNNPGTYQIGLAADVNLTGFTLLGQFALTTGLDAWEATSFSFLAPTEANILPLLVLRPIGTALGTAYPGLDLISLTAVSVATVPEPGSLWLLVLGLGLVVLMRASSRRTAPGGA
jgi:hypothetical protein